ncbi:unnamed protein product, partial [Vitrella brassicaformis CCMP3155]
GLGLLVADWLVEEGAKHIALVSRRGRPTDAVAASELWKKLTAPEPQGRSKAAVHCMAVDVSRKDECEKLFADLKNTLPKNKNPVRGIFHAAAVLDDAALNNETKDKVEKVYLPKVMGAWYLHELSLDEETPLDHFMMFSSAASLLGNFGQANYSAANSCLDALTEYRRSKKLAAQSIQWGPWIEQGMAVELKQHLDKAGMRGITNDLGLRVLGDVMRHSESVGVTCCQGLKWDIFLLRYDVIPPFFEKVRSAATRGAAAGVSVKLRNMDAAALKEYIHSAVVDEAATVLGMTEAPPLDSPLQELGIDSLGAVEFRNALSSKIGVKLPATTLFDYPTLNAIIDFIYSEVSGGAEEAAAVDEWGGPLPEAMSESLAVRAQHIGKVVIQIPSALRRPMAGTANEAYGTADQTTDIDGCYVITGGFGGLGLLVADWLVEEGAKHIALVSRRGRPTDAVAASELWKKLTAPEPQGRSKAAVHCMAVDVSRKDECEKLFADLKNTLPKNKNPVRGIFHAAAVLDDAALNNQTKDKVDKVYLPKVMGAWYLHELSLDEETPLDHFMMFSSVASLLGNFGQANYSAANSCLDALTEYRRSKKLAAQSIQWGPWIEQGMAVELKQHLDKAGMRGITNDLGLRVLGDVMRHSESVGVTCCQGLKWDIFLLRYDVIPPFFEKVRSAATRGAAAGVSVKLRNMDAAALKEYIHSAVVDEAATVLGMTEAPPLDSPLQELGIDSLGAVEFRNALSSKIGVKLPATTLFDYPTLNAIIDFLYNEVSGGAEEAAAGDEKAPSSIEVDYNDMTVEKWLKSAFGGSERYLQFLDMFEAKYPSVEAMAQETEIRLALDVCQVRDEEDFRRLYYAWDKMRSSLVDVSSFHKLSPFSVAATDYGEAIRAVEGGGKRRGKTVDPMDDIKDLTDWLQFDVNTLLPMRQPEQVRHVLLTGVTGFVGRLQLVCLLNRPGGDNLTVHCLVRANNEKHAMQRIREACIEAKVWKEEYASRIVALLGDFTKEDLGVGEDKFMELCRTIDMVHHTGGDVGLLSNYARLRATNTLALKGVLRLCTTYRLKSLHHASTLGIFPAFFACFSQDFDDRLITEDSSPDPKEMQKFFPPLRMGYPWSKWAAEQVLRKARDMGLPVCVYRLPNTFVAWRTGYTNKGDYATALTISSIEEGMFPVGASAAPFTPVDTIAEMLVELSFLERRKHWLYHLINTTVVTQAQSKAWADELGIKYYGVKIDTFLDAVKKHGPESPVFKFVPLMQHWRSYWFDCDERTEPLPIRTQNIFDELPHMAWPPVKEVFRASFQYSIKERFFSPQSNSVTIDADHALEWARKHTDGLKNFAT